MSDEGKKMAEGQGDVHLGAAADPAVIADRTPSPEVVLPHIPDNPPPCNTPEPYSQPHSVEAVHGGSSEDTRSQSSFPGSFSSSDGVNTQSHLLDYLGLHEEEPPELSDAAAQGVAQAACGSSLRTALAGIPEMNLIRPQMPVHSLDDRSGSQSENSKAGVTPEDSLNEGSGDSSRATYATYGGSAFGSSVGSATPTEGQNLCTQCANPVYPVAEQKTGSTARSILCSSCTAALNLTASSFQSAMQQDMSQPRSSGTVDPTSWPDHALQPRVSAESMNIDSPRMSSSASSTAGHELDVEMEELNPKSEAVRTTDKPYNFPDTSAYNPFAVSTSGRNTSEVGHTIPNATADAGIHEDAGVDPEVLAGALSDARSALRDDHGYSSIRTPERSSGANASSVGMRGSTGTPPTTDDVLRASVTSPIRGHVTSPARVSPYSTRPRSDRNRKTSKKSD